MALDAGFEMRFGDCLAQLIDKYGWKRPQFAKALGEHGVHPTQVRRWLRNERTPKLNSGYWERIADLLGLSEADREHLRDAQVQSLQGRAEIVRTRDQRGLCRLPEIAGWQLDHPQPAGSPSALDRAVQEPVFRGIRGRHNLLRAARELIAAAPAPPDSHNREILLMSQGEDPFHGLFVDSASASAVLHAVLEKGYDVTHLVRLGSDARRSAIFAERMLKLLATVGRHRPHYFPEYRVHRDPYEILVVPGRGALIGLATKRPDTIDAGLVLADPQQVQVVRSHFAMLRAQTRPLLVTYSGGRFTLEYLEAIVRAEEKEGDDLSCMPGLDSYTQPYSWLGDNSNWARSLVARNIDSGLMIDLQRRRLNAFYQQVERYRFWQICPKKAILRLVREGEGNPFDSYHQVALGDRLEQLENVIVLLDSFDNYRLALISEAEERSYLSATWWQVKWDVKGDHRVLLEPGSSEEKDGDRQQGLEILEPVVCRAFRDHFLDLFENRISPLSKDKREVRLFLEAQTAWLRKRAGKDR